LDCGIVLKGSAKDGMELPWLSILKGIKWRSANLV